VTRRIASPLAAIVALGMLAVPVMAQDASPSEGPAGSPPAAGTGSPRIGDTVIYDSLEGQPLGSVTVRSVQPGFDEFSEFFTPEEGFDYVAVDLAFVNTGEEDLEVSTFRLSLETPGGFLWGTGYVGLPEDTDIEELESSFEMDEGEDEDGVVFFLVPRDTELLRIWWTPDTGRLLELADLRD
jgi:hypothetical protein